MLDVVFLKKCLISGINLSLFCFQIKDTLISEAVNNDKYFKTENIDR